MLLLAANTLPVVAGVLICVWASCMLQAPSSSTHDGSKEPPTGLSWARGDPRVFHWHPILMTLGFVVCGSAAMLSFRTLPFSHSTNKAIHGSLHVVAALISHLGMLAMARYYDEQPTPRKLSLHTALGGLVWALFSCLWLASFCAFVFPGASTRVRRAVMPHHVAVGLALLSLVYAAAGTGVIATISADASCVGDRLTRECAVSVSICVALTTAFAAVVAAITPPQNQRKALQDEEQGISESTLLLK